MKLKLVGKSLVGSGQRPSLEQHEEMQLARYIGSMCRLGFSPTRRQIKDLVQSYVCIHDLKTPFKNNRTGKDWLKASMNRNNLSFKKANMISATRKSATATPFK